MLLSAPQCGQLLMRMVSCPAGRSGLPPLGHTIILHFESYSGGTQERRAMSSTPIKPIEWTDGAVVVLDQTRLPQAESYLRCERVEQVAEAIRALRVRGAPLIGIAAAYAMALAARGEPGSLAERVTAAGEVLRATRPTDP